MIALWITLLVLHRGYALFPVISVQLGEPTTLSCALSFKELFGRTEIHWYKQSVGDTLKIIVTQGQSTAPGYGSEVPNSRWKVNNDKNFSNLTILRVIEEDEGIYHCAAAEWRTTKWSGTYLIVKGNSQRTSNYTVIQQSTASDPVRPGDSVTLQCSVLSDSDTKTCPGGHSVFWVRAGSRTSHPDIIYTDGNRHDECEKRSDSQRSCVYRLSKNISSSDAGTYYCAVVTCGQILFGNGSTLGTEQTTGFENTTLVISIICLVISVIVNIVFICYGTQRAVCKNIKGKNTKSLEAREENLSQPAAAATECEEELNYAALHFTGGRATRGKRRKDLNTEESVYSHVKY